MPSRAGTPALPPPFPVSSAPPFPVSSAPLSPVLRHLCPRSEGFVSPVGWACVPGRLGLCPRSVGFASPVRSFVGDRGRQNAQNAENRRRSRAKMRTGDGTLLDLGRKTPGPATESALTCDGRTAGRKQARKQARRQDESKHGGRHGGRTKASTKASTEAGTKAGTEPARNG